jgi:hypothetical protein
MTKSQALHKLMIVIGLLFFLLVSLQSHAFTLHHDLNVELAPSVKTLNATDTITFPKEFPQKISFLLNKNLHVAITTPDASLVVLHPATDKDTYIEYGLDLGKSKKISFRFSGVIYDAVKDDQSEGLISDDGTVLFGNTYWYPSFLGNNVNFDVTVKAPPAWTSLAQGQIVSTELGTANSVTKFSEIYPQESIYLIAGAFQTYSIDMPDGKKIRVLLRKADKDLAQSFLDVIPGYIEHYSQLIANYPYNTFTVVENLWETGYGMPSFTLLGPTVMRLPFLLTSSLPHEILHNWWGNGVFVDYDKGNWSEGLTVYMADYWQQELQNQDRAYRLNTLINFNNYALNTDEDFPVREFKGRHNSSSQAVGYGKSMMFFHMLKNRVGADDFEEALQDFYQSNLFSQASFDDIQASFEKVTDLDLEDFFSQWLDRKGAPKIEITSTKSTVWEDGSFATSLTLTQTQDEPYELQVPVVWTLESGKTITQNLKLNAHTQTFTFSNSSRPVKVSVDPDFQIFRELYLEEKPATLAEVFGTKEIHYFYDGNTAGTLQFIEAWNKALNNKGEMHNTDNLENLPTSGALVFVGDQSSFKEFMMAQLVNQDFSMTEGAFTINGQTYKFADNSSVLVTRLKNNQPVVWVRWTEDNNPAEWATRLTHYGTYGILVFNGRPVVYKSVWPSLESPLQKTFEQVLSPVKVSKQ